MSWKLDDESLGAGVTPRATGSGSPLLLQLREPSGQRGSLRSCPLDGLSEEKNPVGDALVLERRQPGDVGLRVRGQDEAHRRHVAGCEAPAAQEDVNERASDATVAVRERVDRLELCVGDRGLDDG